MRLLRRGVYRAPYLDHDGRALACPILPNIRISGYDAFRRACLTYPIPYSCANRNDAEGNLREPISFRTDVPIPELNAIPGAWVYIYPNDRTVPIVILHEVGWPEAEVFIRRCQYRQEVAAALGGDQGHPAPMQMAPRLVVVR